MEVANRKSLHTRQFIVCFMANSNPKGIEIIAIWRLSNSFFRQMTDPIQQSHTVPEQLNSNSALAIREGNHDC